MAIHAKDTLGGTSIAQIVDFLFAVATAKAAFTKGLFAGEDGEILDFIPACGTGVGTIAADQGAITEHEQMSIGVEESSTSAAAKTIDMPSVAS